VDNPRVDQGAAGRTWHPPVVDCPVIEIWSVFYFSMASESVSRHPSYHDGQPGTGYETSCSRFADVKLCGQLNSIHLSHCTVASSSHSLSSYFDLYGPDVYCRPAYPGPFGASSSSRKTFETSRSIPRPRSPPQ
jgi:hypothetical protein